MEKRLAAKENSFINVIITGLPESGIGNLTDKVMDICQNLEPKFVTKDLLSCKRLGKSSSNQSQTRPILSNLRLHSDAQYMHRYGKGQCVFLDGIGEIWINPDLSKSEREALYELRQKKRNKNAKNEPTEDGDNKVSHTEILGPQKNNEDLGPLVPDESDKQTSSKTESKI